MRLVCGMGRCFVLSDRSGGEGTTAKDDAIGTWCKRISEATGAAWRYVRINQTDFVATAGSLRELMDQK
jgi:hypothetical protein